MNARTRPLPPRTDKAREPATSLLPIIGHHVVPVDPSSKENLRRLAERFLKEQPDLPNTAPFGQMVKSGYKPYPSLVIEDHSWITLFETAGDISYSYRACTLAGDMDLAVVGIRRSIAFEDYCRDWLGFGHFDVIMPELMLGKAPLSICCARDETFVSRVAERARSYGGLNVLAYMGTGGTWWLARVIAEKAGVPINVVAPPPRLTRAVNNKVWFAHCVKRALGAQAQPKSFAAYGLAALIKEISILERLNGAIAVKLPSSASSVGNVVFAPSDLDGLSPAAIGDEIETTLRLVGWDGGFPLQVTSWEEPVLSSPSVQLWIPSSEDGPVIVEGVFDQMLKGRRSEFCGAVPSALPPQLQERLVEEAAALGTLFQMLGYFGRCSLDCIILGDREREAAVHWVECNGRWGGTSIPMTLANRILGDWALGSFIIMERGDERAPPLSFADFCQEMEPHLYRSGQPKVGAVVLSPSRIEAGNGYEFLVLGRDLQDAQDRAARIAAAMER